MKELITTKELCKKLKLSRPTILKLRNEGMPTIFLGERSVRFDYDKVQEWLKERER